MNIEKHTDEVLTDFILAYSENRLSLPEEISFRELMTYDEQVRISAENNRSIRKLMGFLPKQGVSYRFDQKMAAAFALELEKESIEANRKASHRRELIS